MIFGGLHNDVDIKISDFYKNSPGTLLRLEISSFLEYSICILFLRICCTHFRILYIPVLQQLSPRSNGGIICIRFPGIRPTLQITL